MKNAVPPTALESSPHWTRRRAIAAGLAALACTVEGARATDVVADVTERVRALRARHGLPALGVARVTRDGLAGLGVDGVRCWGAPAPVKADDAWHLGSCTKAITATLAARLVAARHLDWETRLGEVWDPADLHPAWRAVTLRMLLCHRSGLGLNFADELWEREVRGGATTRVQREALVRETLHSPPPHAPGGTTVYSNAGIMVAGAMLERVKDRDWETLTHGEVFAPLGMHSSGFGAPATVQSPDALRGHVRHESTWAAIPIGPGDDNPAATGPAGTVHASLGDWARFVSAHLREDPDYLPERAWSVLHNAGAPGWEYAPGWLADSPPWARGRALHHLGSNGFWVAEASLALDRGVAVLVTTNVADDSAAPAFEALRDGLLEGSSSG